MRSVNTGCMKLSLLLVLSFAVGAASSTVEAFSITDVTFQIPPGDAQYADAAELLPGNDSVSDVNALTGPFDGDPWVLVDKTDDSSSEFMGVTFELAADVGGTSGEWTLSWSETGTPGLPLTMDFVFVTKAANDWGAYLFESMTFTTDPMSGDGTFVISWTNSGGQIPGLSHASIYAREAESDPDPNPVPTPGTLILFLTGFVALFTRQRLCRRRRSSSVCSEPGVKK